MTLNKLTCLVFSLVVPAVVGVDYDGWEFYGGRRKQLRFGLNAVTKDSVEGEPEETQIIVTRDEIDQQEPKEKKKSNFFNFRSRDDYLSLPDRFSVLSFKENADFAKDGDEIEEQRQFDAAWWGRLYLDGFPTSVQYFRAHFGGPPPNETVKFVLASPINMCDDDFMPVLYNNETVDNRTVVVALRGNCTFAEKATTVHASGAAGIVYVNNEEGNSHPSGPPAHDLPISASMISSYDGQYLIDALKSQTSGKEEIAGRFVAVTCIHKKSKNLRTAKSPCEPVRSVDRNFVSAVDYNGFVEVPGYSLSFEFVQAEFGSRIGKEKDWIIAKADPEHACEEFRGDASRNLFGKAVLVTRGECNFAKKGEMLANAGAGMMLLSNNNQTIFRMGVDHEHYNQSIRVASAMIGDTSGKQLEKLLEREKGDFQIKVRRGNWIQKQTVENEL